jgi:AraC-like DNA-binding protein
MENQQKNLMQDLNVNVYSFIIEDVRFTVKTDRTFIMPEHQNINFLDYTSIHHHVDHEIFFITDGKLLLNLKDSSNTYSDCIICLPAFVKHFSKASSLIYRFMLNFKKATKNKPSQFYNVLEKTFLQHDIQTFKITESISNYLHELDLLLKSNRMQKELRISALLTCIIMELLDANTNIEFNDSNHTTDYVSRLEYIFNNQIYSENLSLDYIAKELSLSTKQVSRIIKKNYNSSLTEIVNDKKLSAATLMLENTDYSIDEIIKRVNFKTENYFFTLFKKRYGITPLKYRKLHGDN